MAADFEQHLSRVAGKIRRIPASSRYHMHDAALLPWWNKAESLHASALVVWHAYHDEKTAIGAQSLGFAEGFSLGAALPPVFCLLAGLSIEVLLKAICKGLEVPVRNIHRLADLVEDTGITVNEDDKIILRAMTEYIYWAGRYPTPSKLTQWNAAEEVFRQQQPSSGIFGKYFIEEREMNLENYGRLWNVFAECFWKVEQCTYESVEFGI